MSDDEKKLKGIEEKEINPEDLKEGEEKIQLEELPKRVKELVGEVGRKGDELLEKIQERKPPQEIIDEFKGGEGEIEGEADNAANLIIKDNNMENRGESLHELTINEVFDSIIERANQIYLSDEPVAEKKQEIKNLLEEVTKATTNDKRFDDTARKTGKWREAGNTLFEIDKRLVFDESEEKFNDAFRSVDAYNQTMPNYFRKRSENLGKIVDGLKNKKVDPKIISLVEKIVIEDREDMINTMCRKENIDIYYANPGADKSNVELSNPDLYTENLLKNNIKESDIESKLKEVDDELNAIVKNRDFVIDLFSGEYIKARSFFETAKKSNNTKEQQVYYMVVQHILEGIEKGVNDAGIKKALKNNF